MNATIKDHVSEETLETYALEKLSEEECAPLEEHLLICRVCQRRLEQIDEYTRAIQYAARSLERNQAYCIRQFSIELAIPGSVPGAATPRFNSSAGPEVELGSMTLGAWVRVCVNTS